MKREVLTNTPFYGNCQGMRQDLVVTKANALVESSYRLNISEQRVLALLTSQVQPDDEDFKPYRFKADNLQDLIESSNKDGHARLRELALGLAKKVLHIRRPRGGWLVTNWLSSAEYFAGEGVVELCFDPKLKPYMLKLKERFTTYKLANVVKLRSRYSVRLFELLKQYEKLGNRSFELAELRGMLGVGEAEYAKWKDFRVNVLDLAKQELPKKTDIGFSYTTRKRGRAVGFVDFKIWNTDSRAIPRKKLKALEEVASKCYVRNPGCTSPWSRHKDNPSHPSGCYWCERFEKTRAEHEGQQKLFPETES